MLGADFLAECEALAGLVETLDEAAFARRTDFYGWTVRDEVMHLYFIDALTQMSLEAEDAFLAEVAAIRRWQQTAELSDYMRKRYADLTRDQLVAVWREGYRKLAEIFASSNPKGRMKWFGPDMSILSATSARQMEVWAHGQDLYDLFGLERVNTDRIRNICEIGVRTYGWTFVNRKLDLPGPAPEVTLTAPSGAVWRWNEGETSGSVSGPAEDFAMVVTQRRHVDDTRLAVRGAGARAWMEIAQCFAGAPSDGPPPRSKEKVHEV